MPDIHDWYPSPGRDTSGSLTWPGPGNRGGQPSVSVVVVLAGEGQDLMAQFLSHSLNVRV
jgi:hypothetical protein